MNSDMDELLRAASYGASIAPLAEIAAISLNGSAREGGDMPAAQSAPMSRAEATLEKGVAPLMRDTVDGSRDTSALAAEIRRLTEATRVAAAGNTAPPKVSSSSTSSSDSGTAEMVIRTAAMMTGVGPIVTGLMKLFGSSEPEALPPLEKFLAASPIAVEAGLTPGRELGAIRYAQGGAPEALPGGASQTQAPTIQVNIQAMDSQSFLDRQDDIARAVREAMLHSNSLNDVVMEL